MTRHRKPASSMLTYTEYSAIVEQAPIMIWRARTDKLCDYFNQRWLSFTGRTLQQEFGNGWAEGVHVEDFDRCLHIYSRAFDRRETFEMRYRLRRHDGKFRWLFDRGVPYFAQDGSFLGYIGSCIDITEQVEAEQQKEAHSTAELQRIGKLLPVCAWCKKIRNDEGYWKDVQDYLEEQHQQITHSVCVDCQTRILQGMSCRKV